MNVNNKQSDSIDIATARKLWIHCNSCYAQYVDKRNTLFLLACQHIACEKCVTAKLGRTPIDAPTYICPVCRRQVRGRQVNNALPTNLKDMFHPEPWMDGLQHELITSFQRANKNRLDESIHRARREHIQLEKDLLTAQAASRKQYLEQHQLHMDRKQLELRVKKIRRQLQINKLNNQHRFSRRRTISPNAKFGDEADIDFNLQEDKRCRSTLPDKKRVSERVEQETITSFIHNNNHSFIL